MDAIHTSSNTNKRKKTEDENDLAESQNTQSNDDLKTYSHQHLQIRQNILWPNQQMKTLHLPN